MVKAEIRNLGPHEPSADDPTNNARITVVASADSLGQQVLATQQLLGSANRVNTPFTVPFNLVLSKGAVFFLSATIDVMGTNSVDRNASNNSVRNTQRFVWP